MQPSLSLCGQPPCHSSWRALQPTALADWVWLLPLLWNHSGQDVEGLLHLQQPQLSEEGAYYSVALYIASLVLEVTRVEVISS